MNRATKTGFAAKTGFWRRSGAALLIAALLVVPASADLVEQQLVQDRGGLTTMTKDVTCRRIHSSGTTVPATSVALSGFGANATVAVAGTDMAGTVTVTTNVADTASASPTATLTFADGTFAAAPYAVASFDSTSTGPIQSVLTHTTATTLVLTYNGTPTATAAKTYLFSYHCRD